MRTTKKQLRKEIAEKEELLRKMNPQLRKSPEGGLTCQIKNGKVYYYHQTKNSGAKDWMTTYIKKKDTHLAKQLAQKEYWLKAKQLLQNQLNTLKHFQATYDETALERLYDTLPEERKQLIEPLTDSTQEKLKAWAQEAYKPYDAYQEHKIYETERGEMVRSKSEVIIANFLYRHRQDLDYKYERPLKLYTKDKKEILIHPDFTIINRNTGKIYYYEHAGKMDDSKYATDFVKKIELYTANNILQGSDLLITYEAAGAPLNIHCVRKIVEKIVE